MDKSVNLSRAGRLSLSRIDEDSIWEKSFQSSPSSSEELDGPEPCQTPEKAKERIRSLEEVVNNVQLDYDTLKEYTVLERQVFNFEKIGDISQPDIVASLLNNSLQGDRRRKSLMMERMDSSDSNMNLSSPDAAPGAMDECCTEELKKTIDNLTTENGKLKSLLEDKENRLKETMEKQSHCTENPMISELQGQIEDLSQQNKRYEETINSLMQVKETYEKLSTSETGEKMSISDFLRKMSVLQEENNNLKLDAESNITFKDEYAELSKTTELLQKQFNSLQNECEELKSTVQALKVQEAQLEEQNLILNNLKIELRLPENPESNLLISLQEYVTELQSKYEHAECQIKTLKHEDNLTMHSDEEITTILKNEIAELQKQLHSAKTELESNICKQTRAGASSLDASEFVINGADKSNIAFGDDGDIYVKNLLSEIGMQRSKIQEMQSSLIDFESNLKSKDKLIADLEAKINLKNTKITNLYSKTNILSSHMSVLTKHLEKLTDNNNSLHILVKEKSNYVSHLENHLSGVRTKLKKFMEQKERESEKLSDVSSFFYNLFDCNDSELCSSVSHNAAVNSEKHFCSITSNDADGTLNVSCISPYEANENESITDILSASKSVVEFSYCLNNLFSSANTSQNNVGSTEWLNEASGYFYQLFDPANQSSSLVEKSELNETGNPLNNTSNYFKDLFNSQNDISGTEEMLSVSKSNSILDQTPINTSNCWYSLFDSFLSARGNKTNDESVLNASDYLGNLFKSQNLSINKSLNITDRNDKNETISDASSFYGDLCKSHNISTNQSLDKTVVNGEGDSVLNASNYIGNLFKSRNTSMSDSLNASKNQSNLSENVRQNSNLSQLGSSVVSADSQSLVNSNASNLSGNQFNESTHDSDYGLPEIALCDGTFNSTAMFHGNNTCLEDPFKSLALDSTIVDRVSQLPENISPEINDSLSLKENEDNFMSSDLLLQKIVDLKILLNQFEDGINDISSCNSFSQVTNPHNPLFKCLSSVSKSYVSVYSELKALIKSFNIDNLSFTELENPPKGSSEKFDLTLNYDAAGDKILASNLNDKSLLISNYESQIDEETETSKTLEETIDVKEKQLEELRSALFNSQADMSDGSVYEEKVVFQEIEPNYSQESIPALETEIQLLKTELSNKEQKIKELTNNFLEELKAKDANTSELQSHYGSLVSKIKSSKVIINSFNEELMKFENISCSLKQKIAALLTDLKFKTDPTQPAILENVARQFSNVESEIEKFCSENLANELNLEISDDLFEKIKGHLIRLISENMCLQDGLVEVLTEVRVLKSQSESKDVELASLLEMQKQKEETTNQKAADLEKEVLSKESSIEDLRRRVEDFNEDKKYFETEMIQLLEKNDVLTSQIEAKELDVVSLKEETEKLAALKQNLMELTKSQSSSEKHIADLTDQLNTLQSEKVRSELELQQLEQTRSELNQLEKKLAEKEESNAELEEKLKGFEEDKQHSENEMITLKQEIDSYKSQLESKNSEAQNLLTTATENFELLKQELKALSEEKASYENRTLELTEEVKVLQAELMHNELRQQQIESLQVKLAEVEKILEDKENFVIELQNKLKEFEEDKKHFEEKLNQVMEETEKSQEETKNLAALEQSLADLAADKSAKENRIEELLEQLSYSEKEKNDKDEALQSAEETMEGVCLKLDKVEQELEEKLALVEDLQKKLCECEESRNHLENKMEKLVEEQENLRKDSENLTLLKENLLKLTDENLAKGKHIEELMNELNDFKLEKDENARVKEIAEQTDLRLAKTEIELKEKENQIEALQQNLKDFNEDQKYYEERMIKLMETVDELKLQILRINPENDLSILETSVFALEQTITEIQEEKMSRDKRRTEFNESIIASDGRVSKASEDQYSVLQAKLQKEEQAISELKEKLNSLSDEKSGKELEVCLLLKKIDDYQAKVENHLNEKDRLLMHISKLEGQIQGLNKSLNATRNMEDAETESNISEKSLSTSGIKTDEEPEQEVNSSRSMNAVSEYSKIDELLKEMSDLKALNTQLETKMAILSDEKSRLVQNLEQKIIHKEDALSNSLSEIKLNNEQINLLMTKVEELEKRVSEKTVLIVKLEEQIAEIERLQNTEAESKNKKSYEISEEFEIQLNAKDQRIQELTQRLASVEAEIFTKSSEISKLLAELEQKSSEISTLEKSLSDAEEKLKEFDGIKDQLMEMEIKVKTSEDLIDVFQKKIDGLEEEKKIDEDERKNSVKKLAVLHESVCSKTSEIESLKAELAKVSELRDTAVAELKEKVSELESVSTNSDNLRELSLAKQNLIKEIKHLKADAQIDNIPLSGLVPELMNLIMETQKDIFSQLFGESEALKSEIKFLKSNDKQVKEWVNKLESDNNELQISINEKVVLLSTADNKLSLVENELSVKTSLVEDLQSQIKAKEIEILQLNSGLTALQDSMAAQQKTEEINLQTDAISTLNEECDSMRNRLEMEEKMIASLKKQIDEEVIKFTELNEECSELKQKLNETALLNEALEKNLICKDDEIHQLKESLERNAVNIEETNKLRNEYKEVVTVKESLSADVASLRLTVDEKSNAIKNLENMVSHNIDEVTCLKKDLEEKSLQVISLTEEVDAKSSEIDKLNAQLAAGTNLQQTEAEPNQIAISEEKLQALTQSAKSVEESEGRIDSLNSEIKTLKNTINRLKSDIDESVRTKTEYNQLKLQIKNLMEDKSVLESKFTLEKGNGTIMKSKIKKLEEEKALLTGNLKCLEVEKTKLMEELEDLKSGSFDNAGSFNSSLDGSKKSTDSSPSNVMFKRNVKCEKLNRKNATLEKKVESLMEKEEKLQEIEQSLKSLLPFESSCNSVSAIISLLKEKLSHADGSLAKLSDELKEKENVIAQQTDAFKGMKLALEKKIEELTKYLEQKEGEIVSLNAALKESDESKKTLDEECVLTWQQCVSLEKDLAEALKRENELKLKLHETTALTEIGLTTEEDLMKVIREKETINQENLVLSAQVRNLKNEKRQLVSDFYNLKTKSREFESDLVSLKTKVNHLEEEKKVLDSKNNSLTKKLIEVTDEKESLSSNLNTLLAKYDKLDTAKKSACDDQLTTLKNQIQKYKHELVEKNAKITMLELQIQSENFPYRSKVLELESSVTSYKKKCEDLRTQLRRHQASLQEATVSAVQECGTCYVRRTRGKSDVETQTSAALHLDGERSSIVQANADALLKDRVKKLEREHDTMKRLCRIRAAKISNLEQYIKQNNLPVPDSKENPEPVRPVTKATERESSFSSRRVLNELIGGNSHPK